MGRAVKPTVFIHTNDKQIVGAIVSEYSLRKNSKTPDAFDVKLIRTRDHPFLAAREDQEYLRDGVKRRWHNEDLQSFTPLRFMPPELMGYQGRALVVDPDVFAVGDVCELLSRDMKGAAILCRPRSGHKEARGIMATSVMLLDCAKLTHWRCERQFNELFEFQRDYSKWIGLLYEDRNTIQLFEHEWNDLDRLTPQTKLLHNTKRKTQPWKTGLPVDFLPPEKPAGLPILGWLHRVRRQMFGDYAFLGHYSPHPDQKQEVFFFNLLKGCIEADLISEAFLREEMKRNHVRHDAFEVLERTAKLAA